MPQGWQASAGGAAATHEEAARSGRNAMSELTRRRDTSRNEETWLIFLEDLHIGTIGRRAGVPTDAEQWGWRCGIPSGSQRGACTEGTAADFAEARSQFDAAWRKL